MSYVFSLAPTLRGAASLAAASVAFLAIGCVQDPQPSQHMSTSNGQPSAVQASDTSQAPAPADSHVSMAFPTGNRATSELLLEQIGPREVRVNQPYNYQIRVTNLTAQHLTGVVLQQRLPEGFTLSSGATTQPSEQAPAADGTVRGGVDRQSGKGASPARIDVGELGPNQSKTIQMSGTPTRPGPLDTCLSAHYNPPTLCSVVNVVAPAVQATVEGPSQADVCQDLTYHYRVTNTGTGTAHNVVVQENLPDGLQTADGQKAFSANVGDLAQGQSKDVTARLKAAQAGKFTTQAIVRSDIGQVQTQQITTAVLAPRLAVTVAGPKEDYVGQPLTYQVTVKNNGDAAARSTKVRLGATPGRVQFVSAQNAQGSQISKEQEGTGQDLGTLAPGQSQTVSVTFQTQQGGPLSLDATAEAQCAQPVTTPVNTNILSIAAAALIVTHDPDPVRVGNNVVYHIVVENKGTAVDRNVTVKATLPDSEQYVRSSGSTNATADGQTLTFAPISSLAPKQSMAWDVVVKALKADEAQFKASMTSESTKTPASKVEPTKLYGGEPSTQQRTNEASQPAPIESSSPPAPTAPADLNK